MLLEKVTNDVKAPPRRFDKEGPEADLELKSQQQRFIQMNEKYRASILTLLGDLKHL